MIPLDGFPCRWEFRIAGCAAMSPEVGTQHIADLDDSLLGARRALIADALRIA